MRLGIYFSFVLITAAVFTENTKPVPLIYDTDMGNDVDDGFALSVIHSLQDMGECELLAVTVTKDHVYAAPFVDILNTYHGRPDIPVGVVRNGSEPRQGKFLGLSSKRTDGKYKYPHDLHSGNDAPEATDLLRKVLSEQEDNSVVIAQVGFSTNLARLLKSMPDEYSDLNGKDLIKKKVKVLSVMAGAFEKFNGKEHREYNVVLDIPSAQKLAAGWPTAVVYSGFEIGIKTKLPVEFVKSGYDFDPDHPMVEAYDLYNPAGYRDQPSWDLTSVLWGVRPDGGYFDLSPTGTVTYDDKGLTYWEESEKGNHRYLLVDDEQIMKVKKELSELTTRPPELK